MAGAGLNNALPLVSVVVPVFRDAARIQTCVRALEAQTYPEGRFEIIVVDNGENGDLRALLQQGSSPASHSFGRACPFRLHFRP